MKPTAKRTAQHNSFLEAASRRLVETVESLHVTDVIRRQLAKELAGIPVSIQVKDKPKLHISFTIDGSPEALKKAKQRLGLTSRLESNTNTIDIHLVAAKK